MSGIIEQFFDHFSRITGIMMEQRLLGALVIMASFAILAILVDFFIHRVFNVISKKSNVDIDHSLIGSIHRPAWILLVLFGALIAVMWLNLDRRYNFIVIAILKTLLIIVGAVGLGRLMKTSVIFGGSNAARASELSICSKTSVAAWCCWRPWPCFCWSGKSIYRASGLSWDCGPDGGAGLPRHPGQFFWQYQHFLG